MHTGKQKSVGEVVYLESLESEVRKRQARLVKDVRVGMEMKDELMFST